MPSGGTPTASVSNRSVTVSWPQRTIGGSPVEGYVVRRYDGAGNAQMIGASCAGTISGLTCTETGVPGGSWRYKVAPRHGNWAGAEGSFSSSVTVAAPAFTLSGSTQLASLPGTLTGTLSNYISGETVTLRLDDPSSGTVLSGTVTPSTIPSNGTASVSVTIPAGTTAGTHTVYAVGSAGDSVGATFTVVASVTTSAWDLRDGSSGTLVNSSAQPAFSGDGLTINTGNWANAFSTSRYVEFDSNGPLPAGQTVTGANFNFRMAATAAGETACYYFEVRQISTGQRIATHGDSGNPVACVTGTTQTTTSTPIPEVSTSGLADDVRIRVYGRSTASRPMTMDLATVSGSAAGTAFTLYTTRYVDATSGTAGAPAFWSIGIEDATPFEVGSNWSSSFATSDYLRLTFPAYVPSSATMKSATLKHVFRPSNSGNTACWYAEVYSGGSLIGTHGTATAPFSCRTGSAYSTDSATLTEVDTPARANDLTVRMYFRVTPGGSRRTQHDLAELNLTYVP
jgi:hypothetical protein